MSGDKFRLAARELQALSLHRDEIEAEFAASLVVLLLRERVHGYLQPISLSNSGTLCVPSGPT